MSDLPEWRVVTGDLVNEMISGSSVARVEFLRRESEGHLNLSLRQRALALYWFGRGFHEAELSVDGQPVEATLSSGWSFGLVAAGTSLEAEFRTDGVCDYAVMFVDAPQLAAHVHAGGCPLTIFEDRRLFHALQDLHDEVLLEPHHRDLLVEGWALHAMVRLTRRVDPRDRHEGSHRLSPASLKRVDDLIKNRIAEPIRVEDMAAAAGYSIRHFTRAFKGSTGKTPAEYLTERRVKHASALIRDGVGSMTTVAALSGFATPQHFSTTFRRQVGISPRRYADHIGHAYDGHVQLPESVTSRAVDETTATSSKEAQ